MKIQRLLPALLVAALIASPAMAAMPKGVRTIILSPAKWNPNLGFRDGGTIAAWWSAADHATRMTDDGGGLISSWSDRITSLAVTGTTTARPTWSATGFRGVYPGVTFDGTANALATTTLTALPTGATAGEIWAVGTQTIAQVSIAAAYGSVTGGQFRRLRGTAGFAAEISDGTTANSSAILPLTSSPFVMAGQMFATTENLWANGLASAINPTTIATLATGTTRLRIGASNAASAASFYAGPLADIMVISGTLSVFDRNRLFAWFSCRYGLSTGGLPFAGCPFTYP